jgi:hypothetical protein
MGGTSRTHMEMINIYIYIYIAKSWLGSLKGKDHPENLGGDGRIILKWI